MKTLLKSQLKGLWLEDWEIPNVLATATPQSLKIGTTLTESIWYWIHEDLCDLHRLDIKEYPLDE